MAARLLSREKSIPYGFHFYIPTLPDWKPPNGASFDIVVQSAMAALQGNKGAADKLGWDLSYNAMADRVDEFNARICQSQGWDGYITQSSTFSVPKLNPQNQQTVLQNLRSAAVAAKDLMAGAKTLIEWKASGEAPVPVEQAEARAQVCAACPLNDPQDWTAWFTKPAAELIRKQVAEAHELGLKTSVDEKLHCCSACHCPLQVKVWPGIEWITKRLTPAQVNLLRGGKDCWIIREGNL